MLQREISGVHEAAYLLGIFSFLSLILGFVRDRLLASTFGAGEILDAYYAAFKIPDTIFVSVASLVSASVLVPFLIKKVANQEKAELFVNSIFTVFGMMLVVFCLGVFVFARPLVSLFFSGFGPEKIEMTILLTRIMLVQPIFLGLSGFLSSIIQARQRFFSYALAPVLYNAGIIIGVLFLYPIYGISGLAFGVVFGAFLHFLIQWPSLVGLGLWPKISLKVSLSDVFEVFKVSLPRTLALSASSFSLLGLLIIGSRLGEGSVSVFNFGWNIQSAPLSVIAASYSMAAFPALSKFFHSGDFNKYLSLISNTLKHIIFWVAPATVLLIVLRAQIVRSVLGFGEFDWTDTRLTAAILAVFAFSILAQSFTVVLIRAYYASGNTKIPLYVSTCSAGLSLILAFFFQAVINRSDFFAQFLRDLLRLSDIQNVAVLALPIGYSLAIIFNAVILLLLFKKKFSNFHLETGRLLREHVGASLSGGITAYITLQFLAPILPGDKIWGVFLSGFLAGILGLAVIGGILWLIKNQEFLEFKSGINTKIFKAKPVGAELPEG